MNTKDKEILLRIRRKYSKEDAFRAFEELLKTKEFELGQMKSYCAELEHSIKKVEKQLKKKLEKIEELRNEILQLETNKKVDELDSTIRKQKKEILAANQKIVDLTIKLKKWEQTL